MKKATLSELCAIAGGIPAPKETSLSGDIPFVRMRELGNAHLSTNFVPSDEFLTKHDEKAFAAKIIQPGATLFPRSGSVHLNHRALLQTPAAIVSHIAALIPNEGTDSEFLYHLLTSYDMTEIMTQTTGLNMIKFGQLKDVLFKVPETKPEQSKIAEILTLVDYANKQTEALIAKQQRIKTGLMQDLLTKGIDEHGNIRSEATHAFKDSPLGRIPVEWDCQTTGALLVDGILSGIQDGNHGELHPKSSDFVPEGVPFVMASDIASGEIDFSRVNRITEEQYRGLRIGFAQPRDVLLSHKASIGFVALVPDDTPQIMLTPQVTYYRIGDRDRMDYRYLAQYLRSEGFQEPLKSLAKQSTRDYIGILAQQNLHIAYPSSLAEQVQIAEILGEPERATKSYTTALNKLRVLKSGLMHDLLTGERRVTPLLAQAATQ